MAIYKIPAGDPHQRSFRILSCVAIILLLCIMGFAIYKPGELNPSVAQLLGWTAGAIVLGSVVGGQVLGIKAGMRKMQRGLEWELTGEKLIQRNHTEGVTREISLADIATLQQYGGGLTIKGAQPTNLIKVPSSVNDFEDLKRKLSAHCTVTPLKVR